MYVPAGLLFVLALWFLVTHDNRPIPGWLYVVGLLTCAVYAPWNTLIVGTIVAIVLLPIGLFLLCAGSMHLLEKGAKALPACWLFDGPTPKAEPQDVLMPDLEDLRVDRARRALLSASHR